MDDDRGDWEHDRRVDKRLDRIVELERENARLRDALEWYEMQVRWCRTINRDGNDGRMAIMEDGGQRAREALEGTDAPE